MKPKIIILLFGQLVVSLFFSCENKIKQEQKSEKDTVEVGLFQPDFQGRLFTSGLSEEEARRLQLEEPVYQITGSNSFFFSGHDSLQPYIGSCIGVKGERLKGWEGAEILNGQFTYNREAIGVASIAILPLESCSDAEVSEKDRILPGTYQSYKGTPVRMERPAPDITYDYSFRLDEPFYDEFNQVEPNKLLNELPLEVYEPSTLNKIEKAIKSGEKLLLKAYLVHGYAESSALQVMEVSEVE